eukprot:TRINITY_DN6422_c0_g1_i3.p1 TRINITY_DN6422_c0_g1~~TRINITY_DN6422_c0_g1_i3.p1  ORF type:complete len:267 (+),score=17.36 TRINITY_DN6422_c0_g1_i3:130-930(+)
MARRDVNAAKAAYKVQDHQWSKLIHDAAKDLAKQPTKENHKAFAEWEQIPILKNAVLGAVLGISLACVILATACSLHLVPPTILQIGVAFAVGGSVCLGMGKYLSLRSDHEFAVGEKKRELWELENFPEGEIREMIELYVSKGFSQEDAQAVMNILVKNQSFFIDHMLVQELNLMPPDPELSPARHGVAVFVSYLVAGLLPFLPLLFSSDVLFVLIISAASSTFCLLCLGAAKAKLSGSSVLLTSLTFLLHGLAPSAISCFVLYLI